MKFSDLEKEIEMPATNNKQVIMHEVLDRSAKGGVLQEFVGYTTLGAAMLGFQKVHGYMPPIHVKTKRGWMLGPLVDGGNND